MPKDYRRRRNVRNVFSVNRSYKKRQKMNSRIISREISSDDLQAALEFYYRSMRVIQPYEEVVDASFTKGPIYVTFTVKDSDEGGIEINSF
jgi:predicted enzyme related to lactoylglutathione lyase